jgi:hypothetical protein
VATHDYNLANATGAAFRSDLNNALSAVASNNSSSSDPATTFAFQWYVDTGDSTLKIRNAANDGYVNVSTVGGIGSANLGLAPLAGPTFTGDVVISSTSALQIPSGTTAQRPGSPTAGDLRFNTTTTSAEIYNGTAFVAVGGGATGAGGDACFYENDLTVTTSYSISANSGAHAVGPLVINSGVTVTVPATSHLVIS